MFLCTRLFVAFCIVVCVALVLVELLIELAHGSFQIVPKPIVATLRADACHMHTYHVSRMTYK